MKVTGKELTVRVDLDNLPNVLGDLPSAIESANEQYNDLIKRQKEATERAAKEDAALQARFEEICKKAGF